VQLSVVFIASREFFRILLLTVPSHVMADEFDDDYERQVRRSVNGANSHWPFAQV
jgi:hypothetical protein